MKNGSGLYAVQARVKGERPVLRVASGKGEAERIADEFREAGFTAVSVWEL